jgi:hypothetical protein
MSKKNNNLQLTIPLEICDNGKYQRSKMDAIILKPTFVYLRVQLWHIVFPYMRLIVFVILSIANFLSLTYYLYKLIFKKE